MIVHAQNAHSPTHFCNYIIVQIAVRPPVAALNPLITVALKYRCCCLIQFILISWVLFILWCSYDLFLTWDTHTNIITFALNYEFQSSIEVSVAASYTHYTVLIFVYF